VELENIRRTMILTGLVTDTLVRQYLVVRTVVLELENSYFTIHWVKEFGQVRVEDVFQFLVQQEDSDTFTILKAIKIEDKRADDIRGFFK
jgi:hypothetical protein